jgi:hypothetical protein
MATTRRDSRFLKTSGMVPTPDLRAQTSGIPLFSSGLPSGSGVAD